jgi:hypothetical protein
MLVPMRDSDSKAGCNSTCLCACHCVSGEDAITSGHTLHRQAEHHVKRQRVMRVGSSSEEKEIASGGDCGGSGAPDVRKAMPSCFREGPITTGTEAAAQARRRSAT